MKSSLNPPRFLQSLCLLFAGLPVLAQTPALKAPGQVAVSGKQLLRDGKPWVPHGFFQIAFAVPPAAFGITLPGGKPFNPAFEIAYTNYSPSEYDDMRRAGADSVRMNVAQNGADKDDDYYFDAQWLEDVIAAVKAARGAGLSVILSLQNEAQTGNAWSPLPDKQTGRVWRKFASVFGSDCGVLFELYNEPNLHGGSSTDDRPSAQDWTRWADAMNEAIAVVRSTGAKNVVVADGLVSAQQLQGAPKLNDRLGQVAYASHPYPSGQTPEIAAFNQTKAAWKQKFGDFAETAPVIITEWGTGYFCNDNTPTAVVNFLSYLQEHKIGLEAVAWDWGPYNFASALQGFPDITASSLHFPTDSNICSASNGFKPGRSSNPLAAFGPGKVIESWYLTGTIPTDRSEW